MNIVAETRFERTGRGIASLPDELKNSWRNLAVRSLEPDGFFVQLSPASFIMSQTYPIVFTWKMFVEYEFLLLKLYG